MLPRLSSIPSLFFPKARRPSKNDTLRSTILNLSIEIQSGNISPVNISLKILELEELLNELTRNHWQMLAATHIAHPANEHVSTLLNIYNKFFSDSLDVEKEFENRPQLKKHCENDSKNPLFSPSLDLQTYAIFKKGRALYELDVNIYILQLSKSLETLKELDATSENILMSLKASAQNNKEPLLLRFHEMATLIASVLLNSPRSEGAKSLIALCTEQQALLENLRFAPQMQLKTITL